MDDFIVGPDPLDVEAEAHRVFLDNMAQAGQQIAGKMLVGDGTPGPPRFPCVVTINGVDIRQDLYEYEIETLNRIASMYQKKHRGRVLLAVRRTED